jgi:hypothetical protein
MSLFDKLFGWIRHGVRDAVVGGLEDAMQELNGRDLPPALAKAFREALPAPVEGPEGNGKATKRRVVANG